MIHSVFSVFLFLFCFYPFGCVYSTPTSIKSNSADPLPVTSIKDFSSGFSRHHNACTRKLFCLLAAEPNGVESYEHLLQGLDYFYREYEEQEPFRTDKQLLHEAWIEGARHSPQPEICSQLNFTQTCHASKEKLMEAFWKVYNDEDHVDEAEVILSRQPRTVGGGAGGLMKRLRKIKLLGRPFLRPEGAEDRQICQHCEAKRSQCFYFYMGTYGLCGGSWLVAGVIGTATCNILTIPRTIDCTINAWFHCFKENCGMVGFKK